MTIVATAYLDIAAMLDSANQTHQTIWSDLLSAAQGHAIMSQGALSNTFGHLHIAFAASCVASIGSADLAASWQDAMNYVDQHIPHTVDNDVDFYLGGAGSD